MQQLQRSRAVLNIQTEDRSHIVGFVFGHPKDVPDAVLERWEATSHGYIELLVVNPDYRNRGVGTSLVKELFHAFERAGIDFVTLHCPAEAREAKCLYDHIGFDVRAYEMGKRL